MLAKHVRVLVRRDMAEIIGATVFAHEVDILRDVHGDSNIEELEGEFEPVEIDPAEEFDRLVNVYGRNDEGQIYVERVIGRGPKQLEALGVKKVGRPAKAE
ncbi:hypothetical protein [Quatrionicoccus australiensis]|uniref:hypothetical protein n=1 Tax=Quatrionicoccus australiensis TaxID=138118 RepID=UPI001CF9CEB6|nr:hypothetical protein [Quatrionicoccus australiensis]MCB4358427.1 hypothetical protein [Quatrionicoccus australiensis]